MKLKQLNGLVKNGCLISNCHGYGKIIGELDEELFNVYQKCKVIKICSEIYKNYHDVEIWIEVTPRLQNRLCKKCQWNNCYKHHMYKEYTPF